MKKNFLFICLQLLLCHAGLFAATTTITVDGASSVCSFNEIRLNVNFVANDPTTYSYNKTYHWFEIYKNDSFKTVTPEILGPGYAMDWAITLTITNANYGSGNYKVKAFARGHNDFHSPVVLSAMSNTVSLSFSKPSILHYRINNVTGTYAAVCHNESVLVTNFTSQCRMNNNLFLSIRETNGLWGATIGTEKNEWVINANPNGFDVKAWAAAKGLALTEGKNYVFKMAIDPWLEYAVALYIKPTAPGLHMNGVQVTEPASSAHNVCASALNTAFNAYSTGCENQYFVQVAECDAYLNRTYKHEWSQWIDNFAGIENVTTLPLAGLTGLYSIPSCSTCTTNTQNGTVLCIPYNPNGFQMTGGTLPGGGDRYWRVTVATNEPVWRSITALVKVNDGCRVVTIKDQEDELLSADQIPEGTTLQAAAHPDFSNMTPEELGKYFKPMKGGYYPQQILPADALQQASALRYKVYPNPSAGSFSVEMELMQDARTEIRLFDINGKLAKVVSAESLVTGGLHTYTTDISDLAKGIYFVRISMDTEVIIQKLVVQ